MRPVWRSGECNDQLAPPACQGTWPATPWPASNQASWPPLCPVPRSLKKKKSGASHLRPLNEPRRLCSSVTGHAGKPPTGSKGTQNCYALAWAVLPHFKSNSQPSPSSLTSLSVGRSVASKRPAELGNNEDALAIENNKTERKVPTTSPACPALWARWQSLLSRASGKAQAGSGACLMVSGRACWKCATRVSSNATVVKPCNKWKLLSDASALITDLGARNNLTKNSAKQSKVDTSTGKSRNPKCKANAINNKTCDRRLAHVPGRKARGGGGALGY